MCRIRVCRSAALLLLVAGLFWPTLRAQSIFTIVGGGTNDGRLATAAALDQPWSVAVDRDGNLYIADGFLHRVRKVTAATGIISSVAGDGAGAFGGDGLLATSAQMFAPRDLVFDADGNLIILDLGNHAIRRVDRTTGIITTIAGRGAFTADNIPATDALLTYPVSLVADRFGNIFVVDAFSIREITHNGLIATVAGISAAGIAVDPSGRVLYFSDGLATVRKKDLVSGAITIFAGTGTSGFSGDNGLATAASLSSPGRLTTDSSGNLFISDSGNHRVRKVDGQTNVITTFLSSIGTPLGLTADSGGNLYVVDQATNRVFAVNGTTQAVTVVAGTGEKAFLGDGSIGANASLAYPTSITQDRNGDLYIADAQHNRIRKWSHSTGIVSTIAGTGAPAYSGDGNFAVGAQLNMPEGVVYDSGANELYIADKLNRVVRKVNLTSGLITTVAGSGGPGDSGDGGPAISASFAAPTRVAFETSTNTLYILDQDHNRIRKVNKGIITNFAGGGSSSADHVPATAAALTKPVEVALDSAGNLYIADNLGGRVRKVNALTAEITTVAGNGSPGFSGDGGTAISASIEPFGIAVDTAGNIFISDSPAPNSGGVRLASHRIRKVDAAGIITTIIGSGPTNIDVGSFQGDSGPAVSARLNNPQSVLVDGAGNLFIADTFSNRIRTVMACVPIAAPSLIAPAAGATGASVAPTLSWSKVDHAFGYDVLLDTVSPPVTKIASDLTATSFLPSNLQPGTKYFWAIVARADPFCAVANAQSQAASFTTAAACGVSSFDIVSPANGATVSSSPVALSWQTVPGALSYNLYVGPTNPPPLIAVGLAQTSYSLEVSSQNYWFVVAHAACDETKTTSTPIRSFTVSQSPGCSPGQIQVTPTAPASGLSGVATSLQLSWSSSGTITTYDVYFGPVENPPLFVSNLTARSLPLLSLAPETTYFWRVVAKGPCDPQGVTSSTQSFTTLACVAPGDTAILFVPQAVAAGTTYTIVWSAAKGLDPGGGYRIERSTAADFSSSVDTQISSSTAASFIAAAVGTYYHRVRAIAGCDPTKSSPISAVKSVAVTTAPANVIFTVQPSAVLVENGEYVEDKRGSFTIENIGQQTINVDVTQTFLDGPREQNFFTIFDPAGIRFQIPLEPQKPKTFEIHYSGVAVDTLGAYVSGSYLGVIVVSAPGLQVIPYAFVNLKIGAGPAATPQFTEGGLPLEYAAFPGFSDTDDTNRPPLTVTVKNPGTTPMELGAEVGPEVWLAPDKAWNRDPIPAGASRPINLQTHRGFAPSGSKLPRYTYFTVRTRDGATARLLVQDNDNATTTGRAVQLDASMRSFIVPEVVSKIGTTGHLLATRVALTNVGTDTLQPELIFTPSGSDGFSASAQRVVIQVPPNDVVSLIDPLVQLFHLSRPANGQMEVRLPRERVGALAISAMTTVLGSRIGFSIPTVNRGDGARLGTPHVLLGVTSSAMTNFSLTLAETSGTDGATIRAALFDGNGTRAGEKSFSLQRYGYLRVDSAVSEFGATTISNGRIELTVDSGGGTVVALGTLSNATGESGATTISVPIATSTQSSLLARFGKSIVPSVTSPSITTIVPVIGSSTSPGAAPTYQTSLTLIAPAGTPATFIARFWPASTLAASIRRDVLLGAAETRTYPNVLIDLFQLTAGGQGSIFVDTPPNSKVYAVLQSSVAPSVPASPAAFLTLPTNISEAISSAASAQRPLFFDGLEQSIDPSRGSRWILLLNETAGAPGAVDVRLYEAGNRSSPIAVNNALDHRPFPIAANQQLQLDTVFSALGLDTTERRKDRTNVEVAVTAVQGNARIAASVIAIDNQTGDTKVFPLLPSVGSGNPSVQLVAPVVPQSKPPGRHRSVRH